MENDLRETQEGSEEILKAEKAKIAKYEKNKITLNKMLNSALKENEELKSEVSELSDKNRITDEKIASFEKGKINLENLLAIKESEKTKLKNEILKAKTKQRELLSYFHSLIESIILIQGVQLSELKEIETTN